MLPKALRLTTKEIDALSKGTSVFGPIVSARIGISNKTKFAVSVSKKVLPDAVDRNKVRRKVYAAVGTILTSIKEGVSIMIMPKKEFLDMPVNDIARELSRLFEKARLIR